MKEIEFKNVTKVFSNDVIGIENVSFEIEKGEFVFIVGRSGSGKSTLLKLLSSQIEPTSGNILVGGIDTGKLPDYKRPYFRRQFGIMERELGLLDDRTAFDNVSLAMYATEQPARLIKKRVGQVLSTTGISHRALAFPHELSVGETARVLLARALVINPKIMIVDEPTANLDPDASWDLMCLLDDLNRLGVTMIVASHSRELVTIMKKRVITLVSGVKVLDEKHGIYNSKAMDIFEEKRVESERKRNQKL
ncbi:cell division ATP-binding protein FtsE [Muricomes intestini]|jgi:cell division transport system ATP-binding protein|uniref:Cell division transport system ATP-binding protein n=1 Tax=Muricomes intestini TaxID=1796634 RepID=A0A4R3KI93_9FIRM|nr:ATP-binding cassette domain-containing protein [Muricomes intestini]TCS82805.1 cell division transport system ATP-binding protein [Muricomes intestini]